MPSLFSALNEVCPLRVEGVVLEDPLGWILRARTLEAGRERPVLIRRFSRAILDAGLASGPLPREGAGGIRVRFDEGGQPCLLWAQVPGRTLAARMEEGEGPLPAEEAAGILQGAGHRLLSLHQGGGRHGALSPHSLWLGEDGSVRIIDLPLGPALADLAPRCPALAAELAPFRAPKPRTPWQADCYALGAILTWALAGKDIPGRRGRGATAAGVSGEPARPVPLLLRLVLDRLLGTLEPFPDPQALEASLAALERAEAPEVQAGPRQGAAGPVLASFQVPPVEDAAEAEAEPEPEPAPEAALPRRNRALLLGAAGALLLAGWAADSCRGPRGPEALDALAAQESRSTVKAPSRAPGQDPGSAAPKLPPRPQSPAVPPPAPLRPAPDPDTKQPEVQPDGKATSETSDSRSPGKDPTNRPPAPNLAPPPPA